MSEEIKETRQEGVLFTIDCLKKHKFNFDYCLDELIEEATNLQNQLQQKENIIKEVREYIKQSGQYLEDIKRFKVDVLEPNYLDILEILDKADKENKE